MLRRKVDEFHAGARAMDLGLEALIVMDSPGKDVYKILSV